MSQEPLSMNSQTANVKDASLMYESLGKCGAVVILPGETWTSADGSGDTISRIHIVNSGPSAKNATLSVTRTTGYKNASNNALQGLASLLQYPDNTIIDGNFDRVGVGEVEGALVIGYLDCNLS